MKLKTVSLIICLILVVGCNKNSETKNSEKFSGFTAVSENKETAKFYIDKNTIKRDINGVVSFNMVRVLTDGYVIQNAQTDCKTNFNSAEAVKFRNDGTSQEKFLAETLVLPNQENDINRLISMACSKFEDNRIIKNNSNIESPTNIKSTDDNTIIYEANRICEALANTGNSINCQANNSNFSVDIIMNSTSTDLAIQTIETQTICNGVVNTVTKHTKVFDEKWKLRFFSPNDKKTLVAVCNLGNAINKTDSIQTTENETTKTINSTSNADIKTTNVEDIEIGLINALKLNKETSERLGDSGKAIQVYIKKGLVTRKPTRRFDYTDYRLLKKPAKFMGHDLAVIEEEYMSEWVGCCVSEGTGVTVKVVGNTENLKQFAKENGCSFSDNVDLQKILIDVGIKAKVFPEHYASLSCRMRDMDMSSNINNSSNKKSNIEFKLLTDVDKTPPSIGRCIWLSCSWGKPLSVRVLQKSLEQVILEVELLGGESTHEKVEDYPTTYKGVDIKWNKEPHKVIITCSYKHPSTSLDGQVSELPLNSKGVPDVLESATNLYFQFCHSYDGNNPIEKFGYNVVE